MIFRVIFHLSHTCCLVVHFPPPPCIHFSTFGGITVACSVLHSCQLRVDKIKPMELQKDNKVSHTELTLSPPDDDAIDAGAAAAAAGAGSCLFDDPLQGEG